MSSQLFFEDGTVDADAVLAEARPLARLVAVVAAVALVPLVLEWLVVETLAFEPALTVLLSVATQFLLAVGTGVVLLYVVARGVQLADA